jgi:oligosaccharide repeat unit polymerase
MSWIFGISMLFISPIETNEISPLGKVIFIYVLVLFLSSSLFFLKYFNDVKDKSCANNNISFLYLFCGLIGLFGLMKYYADFANLFGGWSSFFQILLNDPMQIRAMAAEETSMGFQLSYFSWISLFSGIIYVSTYKTYSIKYFVVLSTCIIIFILNLGFMERTRPTWLLLLIFFALASASKDKVSFIKEKIIKFIIVIASIIIIFPLVSGKYGEEGVLNNIFIYIVGGFPYADSAMNDLRTIDYGVENTFYPISKILEVIGIKTTHSTQILEFREVPFLTNVGTFIEPFIADGGVLYVLIFTPILIFLFDLIGLYMYRENSAISMFVWANLIYCMALAFFASRYTNSAIYLFIFIYFVCKLIFLTKPRKLS